ncbi:sensor histidine kinase [Streptomyces sp. NPDC058442]|uniref:sensor histidine kinase n=1 Tax=Streptomyces sp. NPDC058442 TaxID=3346503 RepID=UPI00365BD375
MNALTPTTRPLARCLHLLVAGLLALTAARALVTHDPRAGAVVTVCAAVAGTYAVGPLTPLMSVSRRAAGWWLAGLGAVWLLLLALTPDAVWLAFPLYFLQLHLLSRRGGLGAVAATAVAAVTAFAVHERAFSPAGAVGPALGAAVAVAVVWGYQALYRESEQRRRLIEELTATRADLATAQHTAGVLAERERLAREIHDTLAQGLSSIQLLLRAAERALPKRPEAAGAHVVQARQAAVDNLAEARRFVAALSPPALEGTTVAGALERLCATTSAQHPVTVRFRRTGTPLTLPTAVEVSLLRIAQSALSNTVRHSGARSGTVTLSYLDDAVALDVVDDGTGFDPERPGAPDPAAGGFGIAGMRARTRALDGALAIESSPGRGTALSARFPLRATEAGNEHPVRDEHRNGHRDANELRTESESRSRDGSEV